MRPFLTLIVALLMVLTACAPRIVGAADSRGAAQFADDHLVTADGYRLPLRSWLPAARSPAAIVVAVHGFNDYSNAFSGLAGSLNTAGIGVYAYDQRGFGATVDAGLWPGATALTADVRAVLTVLRGRHPGLPLFVLGESMGGAVVLAATADEPLPVDGTILVGPAVRGRAVIPLYQEAALWLMAHTVPWLQLTGRGIDITPSDNIEMLRALGADPLVIKETRVDAIWGVVGLMDLALASAPQMTTPALIQYGALDEIIPPAATRVFLDRLPADGRHTIAIYQGGYHMLLRDLEARVPVADVIAWVRSPGAPLPSGADAVDPTVALAP